MFLHRFGRYEILLPLKYNDGSSVEPEKVIQTRRELDNRFGASTASFAPLSGHWFYQRTLYEDELIRIWVDAPYSRRNRAFFRQYKAVLKERFVRKTSGFLFPR